MSDETSQLLIRVSLLGAQAAKAQIVETGAAVSAFGDEAEATGDKTAFAAEKNFLFGESMYSLRRYVFYALTAVGATGAAILKMGYDFDEAKTKSTQALTSLVGGTSQAATEVTKLVALTHASGLGLSTLATAAQQMLTFGFSVKQTNTYMAAFAAYSGKMGLGASGLSTFTTLFNEVKSQTYMSSKQVKELEAMGIPGPGAGGFLSAFNLTAAQQMLLAQGKLIVPESSALPDLSSWLTKYAATQSGGLSYQWGRLHSYLSEITGDLGTPIFAWIDKLAPKLNDVMKRVAAGFKTGGTPGMLTALDPSDTLLHAWMTLGNILKTTAGAVRNVWTVVEPLVGVLLLATSTVLTLTSHFGVMKVVMSGLIGTYIMMRTYTLAAMVATKAAAIVMGVARFAILAYSIGLKGAIDSTKALTAVSWLLDTAMDANPVFLVIGAVTLLGVGFYELYKHVKVFRNVVNATWSWIKGNWPLLLEIITAPFTGGLSLILTHLGTVWNLLKTIYAWVEDHIFKLVFDVPGLTTLEAVTGDVAHPERTARRASGGFLSDIEHPDSTLKRLLNSIETNPMGAAGDVGKLATPFAAAIDKLGDRVVQAVQQNKDVYMDGKKVTDLTSKHKLIAEGRK